MGGFFYVITITNFISLYYMKLELPENQREITLGEYQEFMKLMERKDLNQFSFNKRKVKIFTGLTYKEVSKIKQSDFEGLLTDIDNALNTECKFEQRFEMNGVKFGFIPNLDNMKSKEYFDLTKYNTEVETLHNLMAILFRPIKKEQPGGSYKIAEYSGSKKWADAMKRTPLNIVNGALVFFYNLSNDLRNYTLNYMRVEPEKVKQKSTLKSGAGMQLSTN